MPTNAAEAALVVVLPPGNYTAVVSAASGTGIALLEVTDLRALSGSFASAAANATVAAQQRAGAAPVELCVAPVGAAVASR